MADTSDPWVRWEQTRRMGREQWIWRRGVCGWGLSVAFFFSIISPVAFWFILQPGGSFGNLLCLTATLSFIGFPVGGYFWGASVWSRAEKEYLAAREKARTAERLQDLEEEVDQLRRRLPVSKDTNITE